MAVDLAKITASVERISTVKGSVLTFVSSVPGLIRDAITADDAGELPALNALADKLESDATEITNAITAGTPSSGEPTPTEPTPIEG